ncbi:hypothetical protein HPB50_025404 [Hyalomma asiaticum]|uniref:Uncharacterized protein n=1 Tax=Hyalomma asiaticum TaxID=266040 RepID=A0ACB7TNY4_HYAAI|nr:hypothetical protein HPB50_025404 [Hyalomma asiaticum]
MKLPKREFEIIGVSDLAETATDEGVIRDFSANIKGANGRYEVTLPCKSEVDLADNCAVADKRIQKLLKAPNLLRESDNEVRRYMFALRHPDFTSSYFSVSARKERSNDTSFP